MVLLRFFFLLVFVPTSCYTYAKRRFVRRGGVGDNGSHEVKSPKSFGFVQKLFRLPTVSVTERWLLTLVFWSFITSRTSSREHITHNSKSNDLTSLKTTRFWIVIQPIYSLVQPGYSVDETAFFLLYCSVLFIWCTVWCILGGKKQPRGWRARHSSAALIMKRITRRSSQVRGCFRVSGFAPYHVFLCSVPRGRGPRCCRST